VFWNGSPKEEVRKDITGKEHIFFKGNTDFIANISPHLVAWIQLKTMRTLVKIIGYYFSGRNSALEAALFVFL